MNNIRNWFGVSRLAVGKTEESLDSLLKLYGIAISKYFSCEDAVSASELICKAAANTLSKGEEMFLKWFKDVGSPYIVSILEGRLPDNPELVAQFEYEQYILQEEMNFQYPDDVRSLLVNIITDLPARIEIVATVESTPSIDHFSCLDTYSISIGESIYVPIVQNSLPTWQASFVFERKSKKSPMVLRKKAKLKI